MKPLTSESKLQVPQRLSTTTALWFYGVLACLAVLTGRYTSTPLSLYAETTGLIQATCLGLAAGILTLVLWDLASRYLKSLRSLWTLLQTLLGQKTLGAVFMLALFSSVAEELLFRGVMQANIGIVATSIIFGLLHKQPNKYIGVWSIFATLAGFIFGFLYQWSGGLLAPILAHFLINAVNLYRLTRD